MNSHDLQRFIDIHQIQAVILPMDCHTPTVPDAARALGVASRQIIKSLVFMVKDSPLLVIGCGEARIDSRKLAALFSVSRGRVKMASAQKAFDITGYVVGSMPPFGHRRKLPTVVDSVVPEMETIFGGGGDVDAMMRLSTDELLRTTEAQVASISE